MRKLAFIILIVGLLLGMVANVPYLLDAQEDASAVSEFEEEETPNIFMNGLIFIVGLVLLWFLFYRLLYPFLLKYYHPSYCKNLFWSLLLLYGLAWLTIATYLLFDIGYRYNIMKWIFVFIGVIWIIWFLVIILKKEKVYS
ncbi:MAG: hypothetical protein GTO45_12430 [Candidatus Aminicenantes bacterium]|nr:hypothetical protein [Candidatus Aminicenantes bacterium]NIM79604.1 hypothetical protein [Candidatus Aminicenantes bacterium]NIN18919.1 hypothetical protein [Candidatus Aminicenantes bacterium]NIN42829.1 hypothetical protein [Candidatus Aminicenantes bacterium]NIN85556.1 hypothetical protein [Candidatus Aminicenantes bacterium]